MKKALLGLALAASLTFTSCRGPNQLFNDLHEWNGQVSEQDWVNEVVFLGFTIIPVYSIAYLIGWIILFYVWVFALGLPVGPGTPTYYAP